MKTSNKIITESKKIIKEEKAKIKLEKKKIKENKRKKSKFYKLIEPIQSNEKEYTLKEIIITIIISILIGAFFCFGIITLLCGGKNIILLSKDLNKFLDAYHTITTNYYSEVDQENLVNGAINGMISTLGDNYTNYSNIETTEEFNELVNGKYKGIGCSIIQENDVIKVLEVYENSPAEKAGLKKDDIIVKVDSINAIDAGINNLSDYIKNKSNNKINMIISRDGILKDIELTKETIDTPVVQSEIYEKNDKKVGYINISTFTATADKQFKNSLEKLEKENIQSLVIDVRNNNGGYLSAVTSIASQLLPKGKIIYQTDKNGKIEKFSDNTKEERNYPIAIIINNGSASASEILAASIKESYQGYVVGTTSFGKGTVQQIKKLSDGSMIKYTIETWLSPEGNIIDKKGVEPTEKIELTEEYYNNPTTDNDIQLQKALDLVSK